MHPILSSAARVLLYLLGWLPIAGLMIYLLYFAGRMTLLESALVIVPLCLIYAFICLSPWYLCRVLPIESGRMGRILRSHIGSGVVASFLWIILAKGLGLGLTSWQPDIDQHLSRNLPALFIVGFLLYMLAVSLHYVLLSFQSSREAEIQAQEAQVFAREAELKALKAQINPHFLFNSLNSISALTTVDGAKAREMCIRLSDFLRSTLSLGDKEMIAFSEELALARTYLGVEQIRFGSRLQVQEHVDADCNACRVPPLLLQPLVENAIKHGIAGLLEGGTVHVLAHCAQGRLHLRVENEFDADAPTPRRSGLGLANVRNRLKARYDYRARLDTEIRGTSFSVELTLPCEDAAHG